MRAQSAKARKVAAVRRDMRIALGPAMCARCQAAPYTDLHEPLSRSRGGDPADPAQCIPLCRACHNWIHANPAEATAEGWLTPSWEGHEDDVSW